MQIFSWHRSEGYFWFRLFGYGVHLVDRSKHKPLFSVRNGYTKEYKVGKFGFKFLRGGWIKLEED